MKKFAWKEAYNIKLFGIVKKFQSYYSHIEKANSIYLLIPWKIGFTVTVLYVSITVFIPQSLNTHLQAEKYFGKDISYKTETRPREREVYFSDIMNNNSLLTELYDYFTRVCVL